MLQKSIDPRIDKFIAKLTAMVYLMGTFGHSRIAMSRFELR
jgi:hypothetical protein